MDKDHKNEERRKLKLVERYDNDDYSRFAAPDFIEHEGSNILGHHTWNSGISGSKGSMGNFFGAGPKGYKRSDERIYEDACEMLMRHRAIDATDITVSVLHGKIQLSGRVDSVKTKQLAQLILKDLFGVEGIINDLTVIRGDNDTIGPVSVKKKDLGIN